MRNVNIDDTKNRIIKKLMAGVKGFNERHRAFAGITTFFALLLIVVISFIFSCAGVVAYVFGGTRSGAKKIIAVIAIFLLLVLIYLAAKRFDSSQVVETRTLSDTAVSTETAESTDTAASTDTVISAENATGDDGFQNDSETDNIPQKNSDDAAVDATELEEEAFAESEDIGNSENQNDTNLDETEPGKTITDENKSEKADIDETESEKTAIEGTESEETSDDEFSEDMIINDKSYEEAISEKWDFSEIDLIAFMEHHHDVVGWVYFEDGHISYPIVHSEDNEEYRILDYDKEESRYGAIFLDYRSSGNFTDANSIVYGHNMKDGSMFGTLRAYRQDPSYYDDHQYFQIITPDKTYRYQIFEYMDVPENYVLYDYVADAALSFVADAEPVRIKSYMDSDIVVNKDSKVVTLSTCTRKDDLQFVVLGVLVDEITD